MLVRNLTFLFLFAFLLTACDGSKKADPVSASPAENAKPKEATALESGYTVVLYAVYSNISFSAPAELGALDPFEIFSKAKSTLEVFGPKEVFNPNPLAAPKVKKLDNPADKFLKFKQSQESLRAILEALDARNQEAFVKVFYYNKDPKVTFISILQRNQIAYQLKLFEYPLELVRYSDQLDNNEISEEGFQVEADPGFSQYLKLNEFENSTNIDFRNKVKEALPPLSN